LLELKARGLFPDEEVELGELEPEAAAEELARRLAEYRRAKEAAVWLAERLAGERDRFFRLGPAPLAPARRSRRPHRRARPARAALRVLAVEPPEPRPRHGARVPSRRAVPRALARPAAAPRPRRLRPGGGRLSRAEIAVAFLALLELCKQNELVLAQRPRSRR